MHEAHEGTKKKEGVRSTTDHRDRCRTVFHRGRSAAGTSEGTKKGVRHPFSLDGRRIDDLAGLPPGRSWMRVILGVMRGEAG
jgi:hypothetical protein